MTEGTDRQAVRQPALDGLRAIAVSLVLAYHGGLPGFAHGGFFGVDVFFVLSGYLITDLLLREQSRAGRIRFAGFWARRARRLLPGLLLMLLAVLVYAERFVTRGSYPGLRDDVLSVLGYFSNWHLIATSSDYFAASGNPSLLTHTWSLAIEEQFYVFWPLLLWGLRSWARRAGRSPASVLAFVSAGGAIASAGWMAYLYNSGGSLSRLYYGTDTHAQGLLIGACLAAVLASGTARLQFVARPATAYAGALALLIASCYLGYADGLTYQGGFVLVALAAAAVVLVAVRNPGCRPSQALSWQPVVYLGRISYGMYLWYFPLFAVLDHARTGLSGTPLFALRSLADITLAALSFHLLEEPVRTRLTSWPSRRRAPAASLSVGIAGVAALAGAVTIVAPATPGASEPPTQAMTASLAGAPRLLVVGDSTGETLGLALAQPAAEKALGFSVDVRTIQGCGLVISSEVVETGSPTPPAAACRTGSPVAVEWPAHLAGDLARDHPQIVLLAAGRWEVHTRQTSPGGAFIDITSAADAGYVRAQMEQAVSVVAAAHLPLAIATAPCYASGETPSGGGWPEDSGARRDAYNSIVNQVARAHPAVVRVVDLGGWVCPGGRFRTSLGPVTVRAPDGVHYPFFDFNAPAAAAPDTEAEVETFGLWVAPKLRAALG